MTDETTPSIFDLLEAITEGAPEGSEAWLLKGGYSRNTGGVEMDYIVSKLRAALSTTPKQEAVEEVRDSLGPKFKHLAEPIAEELAKPNEPSKLADELAAMLTPWSVLHEAEKDVEAGKLETEITAWFWGNCDRILTALRSKPDMKEVRETLGTLRSECNLQIKTINEGAGVNTPGFKQINTLLKKCDAVFAALAKLDGEAS